MMFMLQLLKFVYNINLKWLLLLFTIKYHVDIHYIFVFYFQRSELPTYEDDESYEDDNPTVVVLKEGDLSSEEALKEKLAKEQGE